MTEDRDFKQVVRTRAAKTGESYQAARRQLEEHARPPFVARVTSLWRATTGGRVRRETAGTAFGCFIEQGTVTRGMRVTVVRDDHVVHEGVVVGLRNGRTDVEAVTAGELPDGFGLLVEPPYAHGGVVPHAVRG